MGEIVGQIFWYGFYIHLICINLLGFFLYAYDKIQASREGWRVPEIRLLVVVLAGGGAGTVLLCACFLYDVPCNGVIICRRLPRNDHVPA